MTSFPNFAGKHDLDGLITPGDVVRSRIALPETVVLTYQRSVPRYLASRAGVSPLEGTPASWGTAHVVGDAAVVGGFGIGAPAAVVVMEELIAAGARRFLNIGGAGTLQPGCAIGSTVLCTAAIRDEGTSHHYLPAQKFSYPTPALTARLKDVLTARGIAFDEGATWTIDAPYRETVAEARSYQAEGVVTVEMEASAVFAVAEFRRIEVAAAFVVTDSLAETQWTHMMGTPLVGDALAALLEAALTV